MTAMTSYLQKKLLDHALGIAEFTMPTLIYGGLHTASPTDSGSLAAEVSTSATGYARQSLLTKMSATDATTGLSSLNAVVNFGPATADWGTVTYFSISDALTAGNMLFWGVLTTSQTTPIGEQFQLVAGQLQITLD